jgi:hypothetical protein
MPEEEQDNANEPELSAHDDSANAAGRRAKPCPRCGSVRVGRRSEWVVVSVLAAVVLGWTLPLTLTLMGEPFGAPILGVLVLTAVLSAPPVMACVALVGRVRCRACGARFPAAGAESRDGRTSFPWRLFFAGIVLLALLCVFGPRWLQACYGDPYPDYWQEVGWLALFGMGLWGMLLFQVVAYHLLRRTSPSPAIWSLLFTTPALAIGAVALYGSLPRVRARSILAFAELAPLPSSADRVRVCTAWCPDQSDAYVRFHADPNGIERFLGESAALRDVACEELRGEDAALETLPESLFGGPSWYAGDVTGRMWRYSSNRDSRGEYLIVTVDDVDRMVYIAAQRRYPSEKEHADGVRQ